MKLNAEKKSEKSLTAFCIYNTLVKYCESSLMPFMDGKIYQNLPKLPVCVWAGAEGKAGMAAIADPSHSSDLEKFVRDMEKVLPPYARPVFLRFLPEVNKTGKFMSNSTTEHVFQGLV